MDTPHGHIDQTALGRKNDYLYRMSLKAFVMNNVGEVLVVKETGRTSWDLPGGGMDHNESIKDAIARELKEEVNLDCDFSFSVVDIDEPALLTSANVWQVRIIFKVIPERMNFSAGEDADEIAFMSPSVFKDSPNDAERRIYLYSYKM